MARVLFIMKRRDKGVAGSWNHSPTGDPLPSGLSVSATQMAFALDELKIESKLIQVIDNNCIDREVTAYQPTHVIIEAFWVVPDKFDVLCKLHPTVEWIIRNHSKSDFLSHEGGMVGWAIDYISRGLTLACNSPEATADFQRLAVTVGACPHNVVYLPNFYRANKLTKNFFMIKVWKFLRWAGIPGRNPIKKTELKIGCFGAIRPLKNHLHQALASIEAADRLGVKLMFHVNGTRIEGKAEPILNSLRQLFKRNKWHELVELPWMEHVEFTKFSSTMDVLMQVSNSETFNIVAADSVSMGIPVVVSPEIPWLDCEYHVSPNDVQAQAKKLIKIWKSSGNGYLQQDQLLNLREYAEVSKNIWAHYLDHQVLK